MKRIVVLLLILSRLLLASDKIVFQNQIEYECEFIRFLKTENGLYIEVSAGSEEKLNCVPAGQVKTVMLEDGSIIYYDGKITNSEYEPQLEDKLKDSRFPLEVQNIYPAGVYMIPSLVSNHNKLSFSPVFKIIKNRINSRYYGAFGGSYYLCGKEQHIVPEVMLGIKGNVNTNYFIRNNLDVVFKDENAFLVDNRLILGLTQGYHTDPNELILLNLGFGESVNRHGESFLLLFGTGLVINTEENEGVLKPTVEFVVDFKNKSVLSRLDFSLIF